MLVRLRLMLFEYRGALGVIAIVAVAKILFSGWDARHWYLIPFLAAGYGLIGLFAWAGVGVAVSRLYALSDFEFKTFFLNPRLQLAAIVLVAVGNEYQIHYRKSQLEWIARCVREAAWIEAGAPAPGDPVNWCHEWLRQLETDEDADY